MRVEFSGAYVSEIGGWPGNIGDSCANTARAQLLNQRSMDLQLFVTDTGFVRHPSAPPTWREKDFSDDQMLPLFMAGSNHIKGLIRERNPYCAGNGQLHSPLMWAVMRDLFLFTNLFLLVQLMIMRYFPWRWSDADNLKWYQRIESSKGSTADWLNWFCTCVYLKRLGKLWIKLPPLELIASKVYGYYESEPNNRIVLDDYERGFDLFR